MDNIIEINTDKMSPPEVGNDLFENRNTIAKMRPEGKPEVTIIIQAYNRLDKTKRCVESVLENTKDINYELLLLDNGSIDGTYEYFKSIPYEQKRIIRITKNLGAAYIMLLLCLYDLNSYIVILANDIIVTENWLKNLLICIKSDPTIGMVNPACSNTSNQ